MFSPDAARPAKRVYIGNLVPDITGKMRKSMLVTVIIIIIAHVAQAASRLTDVCSFKKSLSVAKARILGFCTAFSSLLLLPFSLPLHVFTIESRSRSQRRDQ